MAPFPPQTQARIKAMRASFLVPEDMVPTISPTLGAPFADIGLAFRQNLRSTLTVVTMPFALASSSVHQSHYSRFSIAERIRSGVVTKPSAEQTGEERAAIAKAADVASTKMNEFVKSAEGMATIADDISRFLLTVMEEDTLKDVTSELLLQSTASVWTAFEVLARDLFVTHLNASPRDVLRLTGSPLTRRRFDSSRVSLDDLVEHGFNLSEGMGTLLAKQHDLSDYLTIKAVFETLFEGCSAFSDENDNRALFLLNQQRHLIVHKRGIVDQRYRQSLGRENFPVGDRLTVTPDELEVHFAVCARAGTRLLELFEPPAASS